MGTTINDVPLVKVVDGDTIKVELDGVEESLRLICVDTEESRASGNKPVTAAGKAATAFARNFFEVNEDGFPAGGNQITVDVEFDTGDPEDVALARHRGNYGRLLCYVHKEGTNYNLKIVAKGYSPYFDKYGRSRVYHREFTVAEASAQAQGVGIWDPLTNAGGPSRDYDYLKPWWSLRALGVEDYRTDGIKLGALSVRLDYGKVRDAAKDGDSITVLCDLTGGVNKWAGGGALIYAGSVHHKFNLWIPDADTDQAQQIIRLIETRYAEPGRGYAYVSGTASEYGGKPQIVLTNPDQISDFP